MAIKYKYAYNQDKEIIDVSLVIKKEKYTCISCNNELIFRKGTKAPHFAHKVLTTSCSRETYLHKLAKNVFFYEYTKSKQNNTKFILEYKEKHICNYLYKKTSHKCELGNSIGQINLNTTFPIIKMESKDGEFIPDILLTDTKGKKKLYIEIAVTHKSDEKKTASGVKIIEFIIEDEKDIEIFKTHKIPVKQNKIIRYNFSVKTIEDNFCKGACKQRCKAFCVYRSGKSICKNFSLSEYEKKKSKFIYSEIVYETTHPKDPFCSDVFFEKVIASYKKGIKIKNCILCRYHAFDPNSSGQFFCKFLKAKNSSNTAAYCKYYKEDKKVFSQYDYFFNSKN